MEVSIETSIVYTISKVASVSGICGKAELPKVGIFFALNFLPWEFLLIKKLEIKKLRPPSIQL